MNKQEALGAVYMGNLIKCTKEDYKREIRMAIQEFAGKSIDNGDTMRARIALSEVERLDKELDFTFSFHPTKE